MRYSIFCKLYVLFCMPMKMRNKSAMAKQQRSYSENSKKVKLFHYRPEQAHRVLGC